MAFVYNFARPAVTVDSIIFLKDTNRLKVLLIKRKNEPFKNCWAFPGGFIDIDEDIKDAAKRELEEECGLKNIDLQQFCTVGTPGRDPRGRTISIIYIGSTSIKNSEIHAGDDAADAGWFAIDEIPELAFDHKKILHDAIIHFNSSSV